MILVFGDSFAGVFKLFPRHEVSTRVFGGATAKGLNNAQSESGANPIIRSMARKIRHGRVIFVFGNVDIHLKFYYKCVTSGVPDTAKYIAEMVQAYSEFVRSLHERDVTIVNVMPAVVDPRHMLSALQRYLFGDSPNADLTRLYKQRPELFEWDFRNDLVRRANQAIEEWCNREQYDFIDINKKLIDPKTGKIRNVFRDPSKHTNVHVMWEPTVPIWCRILGWEVPKGLKESWKAWTESKKTS